MKNKTIDYSVVYEKKNGEFVPYEGEPNFLSSTMKCPSCKPGFMNRQPLHIGYKRVLGGKILVTIDQNDGRMILNNTNPENVQWTWACSSCTQSINPQIVAR